MPAINASFEDRFWSKVDKTPGHGPHGFCWLWTACLNSDGYGNVGRAGRMIKAHRAAYELLVEPVPAALELDHACRVRNCVNPAHLEPVTHTENMRRRSMTNIGRLGAAHAAKTRCPQGHPYDAANTKVGTQRSGAVHRGCRACDREYDARRIWVPRAKCGRGHPYPPNLMSTPGTRRVCSTCKKIRGPLEPQSGVASEVSVKTEGGSGGVSSAASGEPAARH